MYKTEGRASVSTSFLSTPESVAPFCNVDFFDFFFFFFFLTVRQGSFVSCSSLDRGDVSPDCVSGVASSEAGALSVPGDDSISSTSFRTEISWNQMKRKIQYEQRQTTA